MSQEVIALKLSTGEEVLARVEGRDDESITLDRPNIIGLVPGPEGVAIQLMPWFASNQDGTVRVMNAHVVAASAPAKELEKGYLEKTSGIVGL